MAKLTPKQETFCLEYLVDLNATQAAIRAGYSEKSAKRIAVQLLTKSHLTARIQSLRSERQKRVAVTSDYVLTTIIETIEQCKKPIPKFDREGNVIGESLIDAQAVLKGSELLGKHLAMWTERTRLEGADGAALPILKLVVEKGSGDE